jgi:hypothetical protein
MVTRADAFITLSAEHTAFPIKDATLRHRSPGGHHRTLTYMVAKAPRSDAAWLDQE